MLLESDGLRVGRPVLALSNHLVRLPPQSVFGVPQLVFLCYRAILLGNESINECQESKRMFTGMTFRGFL